MIDRYYEHGNYVHTYIHSCCSVATYSVISQICLLWVRETQPSLVRQALHHILACLQDPAGHYSIEFANIIRLTL